MAFTQPVAQTQEPPISDGDAWRNDTLDVVEYHNGSFSLLIYGDVKSFSLCLGNVEHIGSPLERSVGGVWCHRYR